MMLFLMTSLTLMSTAQADALLDGGIDVEVKEWLGIVYPQINLENQSIEFEVEVTTDGDATTYRVNDTLIIDLNVNQDDNRTYIFPRSVFFSAFMRRSLALRDIFPLRGLINRLFPVMKFFKSVNVVKGMLGDADQSINMSLDYAISNTTFESGENLTLSLYVMGFLPGDLNGLSEDIPIITQEKVILTVSYVEKI